MLFGICIHTSRTPKFWHKYVITYGDFMVIVELWKISVLPPMSDESNSNLFLMEFILKCPIIILLEYLTQRFFNPKIISSWCSSGTEFMEIVSDSGLRLS